MLGDWLNPRGSSLQQLPISGIMFLKEKVTNVNGFFIDLYSFTIEFTSLSDLVEWEYDKLNPDRGSIDGTNRYWELSKLDDSMQLK